MPQVSHTINSQNLAMLGKAYYSVGSRNGLRHAAKFWVRTGYTTLIVSVDLDVVDLDLKVWFTLDKPFSSRIMWN